MSTRVRQASIILEIQLEEGIIKEGVHAVVKCSFCAVFLLGGQDAY